MRRILTFASTLMLVALFAMPAQAQEEKVRFALQGGITSSNLSGDDISGTSSKTGFLGGVGFNYFFANNWSLGLEGNWLAGLGAKESGGDGETKVSYFAFPLTLNFAFPLGQNEKTWIGLQSGITAMLNLSCDFTTGISSQSVDCKDDTKSSAFAVPFGATLGFKMSDAAVVYLRARYQLGLSSVAEDENEDVKLNFWEFILGVGFPTG